MSVAKKFGADGIARNTLWNFLGIAAAAPLALVSIPPLVAGLGPDLFGLLTIGWTVMGYFGLFDLGVGRATTKYLAEALHLRDDARVGGIFWTSLVLHAALGALGGLLLWALTPRLVGSLRVPSALVEQATLTLELLAVSVPIIVMTAAARGVLEAFRRFDLVNAVKIPATAVSYLGPLLTLLFTRELPAMIAVIAVGRALTLGVYLTMCVRLLPTVVRPQWPRAALIRPLMSTGGWLTISTLVTPFIASFDRFVIGTVVSLSMVASYAASYEVVTKLWIMSASLLGVLFPTLSILAGDEQRLRRLYLRAVVLLFVLTAPLVAVIIAFAHEFFHWWLGPSVAFAAAPIAQWLAVGVFVNVIAQVPFTTLQAAGHADITAKLQLALLPIYAVGVYLAAQRWGVVSVAMAWSARSAVDAALMFAAVSWRLPAVHARVVYRTMATALITTTALLVASWQAAEAASLGLPLKIAAIVISTAAFAYIAWRQHGRTVLAVTR